MKFLLITGSLTPRIGHNANLLRKLIPFFQSEHEVRLLSFSFHRTPEKLPNEIDGVKVYWARSDHGIRSFFRRICARIIDKNGYSDYYESVLIHKTAQHVRKVYPYDVALATTEPFVAGRALSLLPADVIKALYIMDPPEILWGGEGPAFRSRFSPRILKGADLIFTTQFVADALRRSGFDRCEEKIQTVGFPMLERHNKASDGKHISMDPEKINLLYCGAMSKSLKRSPRYCLDVISKLDERFSVYFIGKGCETLLDEYPVETKAQVNTYPQIPYADALNAMQDADFLINIGNHVSVHLPSKIIEYMSFCKPIINFYKMEDCPTLTYTKRYPCCLNVFEQDSIIWANTASLIDFCVKNKGQTVSWSVIENLYPEFVPETIAKTIMGAIDSYGDQCK